MNAAVSSSALACLAALLGAAPTFAQSFNVDFDDATFGTFTPAATYAAAGTPGVWNAVMLPAAGVPLVDKSGAPTGVTMTVDPSLAFDLQFDNANLSGDDAALMEDIVYGGGFGTAYPITFSGLANGTYTVYTYAMAPDDKLGLVTDVDVLGSPSGVQAVGGSLFSGHAQGVSYALHVVDVTAGTLTVTVAINTVDLSLAGFQIESGAPVQPGAYCFGDGSGTPCPCGNPGGIGEGCANSTGAGALLTATGTSSVSADDLAFSGTQFTPNQPGLLFSADNAVNGGQGVIFGDGLRCAGGTVKRLGVVAANAAGAIAWGAGHAAAGGWVAGDTKRFQGWYRDPAGSPCGSAFNLSHGVELTFVP